MKVASLQLILTKVKDISTHDAAIIINSLTDEVCIFTNGLLLDFDRDGNHIMTRGCVRDKDGWFNQEIIPETLEQTRLRLSMSRAMKKGS